MGLRPAGELACVLFWLGATRHTEPQIWVRTSCAGRRSRTKWETLTWQVQGPLSLRAGLNLCATGWQEVQKGQQEGVISDQDKLALKRHKAEEKQHHRCRTAASPLVRPGREPDRGCG